MLLYALCVISPGFARLLNNHLSWLKVIGIILLVFLLLIWESSMLVSVICCIEFVSGLQLFVVNAIAVCFFALNIHDHGPFTLKDDFWVLGDSLIFNWILYIYLVCELGLAQILLLVLHLIGLWFKRHRMVICWWFAVCFLDQIWMIYLARVLIHICDSICRVRSCLGVLDRKRLLVRDCVLWGMLLLIVFHYLFFIFFFNIFY